jgi:hypothetical protein
MKKADPTPKPKPVKTITRTTKKVTSSMPAKKQTSATGPYKSGMKTDKSKGVRKMTKPAAPKAKGGSQFLPKGVPAGVKKNTPASKTKPRNTSSGPNFYERNMAPRDKNGNIAPGVFGDMGFDDLKRELRNR